MDSPIVKVADLMRTTLHTVDSRSAVQPASATYCMISFLSRPLTNTALASFPFVFSAFSLIASRTFPASSKTSVALSDAISPTRKPA